MTSTVEVTERPDGSILFTGPAHVIDSDTDTASKWDPKESNPFIRWVRGDYVESDRANENGQFWTNGDLAVAEYTIRLAPLNLLHNIGSPIGTFVSTESIKLDRADAKGALKIQATAGIWSHLFPMETEIVEQASKDGMLWYSMESRASHVHCAGSEGCDRTFDYMAVDDHCEHLLDHTSIRHLINPVFRGGALIVPPVQPGWKEAYAEVLETDLIDTEAPKPNVKDLLSAQLHEVASLANTAVDEYGSLAEVGKSMSPRHWEHLMDMVAEG